MEVEGGITGSSDENPFRNKLIIKLFQINDSIVSNIFGLIILLPLYFVPIFKGSHNDLDMPDTEPVDFYYSIVETNDPYITIGHIDQYLFGLLVSIILVFNVIIYRISKLNNSNKSRNNNVRKLLLLEGISVFIMFVTSFLILFRGGSLSDHRPHPSAHPSFFTGWSLAWGAMYFIIVLNIQFIRRMIRALRYGRFWGLINIFGLLSILYSLLMLYSTIKWNYF